ncbi:MAG: methylated-DNA--[protein]-cysteine S-methyltransferase [Candidatus Eremiobacteraeota bacterium]|nr:methylated-DNA--[protein]-cysteine S-methyltransferase [Candidatus Eremiobacteraeota bacterium]
MRCCDVEALWDEMREGVEPRREHVLAHLRGCAHCQELYREYEGVAYCLSCLPVVEAPQGLVPKILDHIKTVRGPRYSTPDSVARVTSPLGSLYVAFRPTGITYLGLDRGEPFDAVKSQIERRLRRRVRPSEPPDWLRERLERYFRTWQASPDWLDMSDLTEFERAAMRKAMEIPRGEVRSYSWIAREIGHPHAARAVGQAMARNPLALLVPCHRVVDASGALHNYGYGLEVKARILQMEGYAPQPRRSRA